MRENCGFSNCNAKVMQDANKNFHMQAKRHGYALYIYIKIINKVQVQVKKKKKKKKFKFKFYITPMPVTQTTNSPVRSGIRLIYLYSASGSSTAANCSTQAFALSKLP